MQYPPPESGQLFVLQSLTGSVPLPLNCQLYQHYANALEPEFLPLTVLLPIVIYTPEALNDMAQTLAGTADVDSEAAKIWRSNHVVYPAD